MKLNTFFVSLLLPVAIVELICLSTVTQTTFNLTDNNTQEQCNPEDCVPPNS